MTIIRLVLNVVIVILLAAHFFPDMKANSEEVRVQVDASGQVVTEDIPRFVYILKMQNWKTFITGETTMRLYPDESECKIQCLQRREVMPSTKCTVYRIDTIGRKLDESYL